MYISISPSADYVPELAALAKNTSGNSITRIAWEDITIGELASHMTGIASDNKKNKKSKLQTLSDVITGSVMGELTRTLGMDVSVEVGFPPLAPAEIPT